MDNIVEFTHFILVSSLSIVHPQNEFYKTPIVLAGSDDDKPL